MAQNIAYGLENRRLPKPQVLARVEEMLQLVGLSLADIQQAEITTTKFIHGWGIHLTPQGWLYNVSGFKAVAFKLKNGKQFVLGTDEPEKLHEAIKNVIRGS